MSTLDFLFNGNAPATLSSPTVSEPALPDWYQEYLRGTFAQANALIDQPFETYTGQRLADVNADVTGALDMVRDSVANPQWQSMMTAGTTWDPNMLATFRNPFLNDTMDLITERSNRNLNESILPTLNQNFMGQFGSSRHGALTTDAIRDNTQALLDTQRQLSFDAENQAQQNYMNWMAAQRSGATQWQSNQMKDALSLLNAGQTQMGLDQQSFDLGYNDWLQQRDYPLQQIGFMSNLIRGMQMPTGQTVMGSNEVGGFGASPLNQIAGLFGSIYSSPTTTTTTATK